MALTQLGAIGQGSLSRLPTLTFPIDITAGPVGAHELVPEQTAEPGIAAKRIIVWSLIVQANDAANSVILTSESQGDLTGEFNLPADEVVTLQGPCGRPLCWTEEASALQLVISVSGATAPVQGILHYSIVEDA